VQNFFGERGERWET